MAALTTAPEASLATPRIHMLMVLCAALVSTSFPVGAALTRAVDPAALTLVRFLIAASMLGPYVYWRHGLRVESSFFIRCALISASLVIFFLCMFWALRYTSALNTSVIFALVPSFSGIYAAFLVGEKMSRPQLIALILGMAGAVWVIFRGDLNVLMTMDWNRGDLIFLGGCLAMGMYTPLIKKLHRGESMLVMTFWILITGSCWLLLFGGNRLLSVDWQQVPGFVWGGIFYLALFTTVITFFLNQYCTPRLGATKTMAYSYLYPGLVLIIDMLLGHGFPPARVLPGVIVVLLAMVVLQYPVRGKSPSVSS